MPNFKYLTPTGRIPANTKCPFVDICKMKDERCSEVKLVDFSCGTARLLDMLLESKDLEVN